MNTREYRLRTYKDAEEVIEKVTASTCMVAVKANSDNLSIVGMSDAAKCVSATGGGTVGTQLVSDTVEVGHEADTAEKVFITGGKTVQSDKMPLMSDRVVRTSIFKTAEVVSNEKTKTHLPVEAESAKGPAGNPIVKTKKKVRHADEISRMGRGSRIEKRFLRKVPNEPNCGTNICLVAHTLPVQVAFKSVTTDLMVRPYPKIGKRGSRERNRLVKVTKPDQQDEHTEQKHGVTAAVIGPDMTNSDNPGEHGHKENLDATILSESERSTNVVGFIGGASSCFLDK